MTRTKIVKDKLKEKNMEAIKFMKELKRYCNATSCENCKEGYGCNGVPAHLEDVDALKIIEFVEKWSEENPIKTRQSEFLKLYPNAPLNSNGYLIITPCAMDKKLYKGSCENCKYINYPPACNRSKYWNEEIE